MTDYSKYDKREQEINIQRFHALVSETTNIMLSTKMKARYKIGSETF